MTAQVPDILMIGDQRYFLFTNPLEEYLHRHPPRPPFLQRGTQNWRGYVALWTIARDRLYLTDISAWIALRPAQAGSDKTLRRDAILADLFPDVSGPVHATWYSGTLRIPQGNLVDYVHQGYASQYERFLLIDVSAGIVGARREVAGARPPPEPRWSVLDFVRRVAQRLWPPDKGDNSSEKRH